MTNSSFTWDDLKFWDYGEWDVIQERLDDLDKKKIVYNPARHLIFAALDATPFDKCKVCFMGQDPYPSHALATGFAFSIPAPEKKFPPTLSLLLQEYADDLGLSSIPAHGDLTPWAAQGVLLWNAIPTCLNGKSLSQYWTEWMYLTQEIVEKLGEKGCVFVFMGSVARDFAAKVNNNKNCRVIETTHPSPRGIQFAKTNCFKGSRLFSRTNAYLNELKLGAIDWRL